MAMCNICKATNKMTMTISNGEELCSNCMDSDHYFYCEECCRCHHTDIWAGHNLCRGCRASQVKNEQWHGDHADRMRAIYKVVHHVSNGRPNYIANMFDHLRASDDLDEQDINAILDDLKGDGYKTLDNRPIGQGIAVYWHG